MAKQKKVVAIHDIWAVLWAEYKAEWVALWYEYKSLIIPFIEGSAKYIWQLFYGLIALVVKGLYLTLKYYIEKLINLIKKA